MPRSPTVTLASRSRILRLLVARAGQREQDARVVDLELGARTVLGHLNAVLDADRDSERVVLLGASVACGTRRSRIAAARYSSAGFASLRDQMIASLRSPRTDEVLVEQPGAPEAVLQERRRERQVVARGEREAADDALGEELVAERAKRAAVAGLLGLGARGLQQLEERVAEARLRLGRGVELEAAARGGREVAALDVAAEGLEGRQRPPAPERRGHGLSRLGLAYGRDLRVRKRVRPVLEARAWPRRWSAPCAPARPSSAAGDPATRQAHLALASGSLRGRLGRGPACRAATAEQPSKNASLRL